MITIAWYNVVAIIVGILFLWLICFVDNESDIGSGTVKMLLILLASLFFTIWGGIFWW